MLFTKKSISIGFTKNMHILTTIIGALSLIDVYSNYIELKKIPLNPFYLRL